MRRDEGDWVWSASGKHPAAKDYLKIGQKFALADSLSEWVEKGFNALTAKEKHGQSFISWRFWGRGSGKERLMCGLLKDSSDSIGRPYPFFTIGMGTLREWETNWDLVPFVCEKTWNQQEYISTGMMRSVRQLSTELQNMRPPLPEWPAFLKKREDFVEIQKSSEVLSGAYYEDFEKQASVMAKMQEGVIEFDRELFTDHTMLIGLWHYFLKKHSRDIPNICFIGGTMEKTFAVFFKRPLAAADLTQLWRISLSEVGENGSFITR